MDWASREPDSDPGLFFIPEEEGRIALLEEGPAPFAPACDAGAARSPGTREPFYGTVVSSRRDWAGANDVDWDPRPLRFNPQAGPGWSRFVPTEMQRPRRGGPSPYQAFPLITQDEAQINPRDQFVVGPGFAPGEPATFQKPETPKVPELIGAVMFFALVVLLAQQLASIRQQVRDLNLLLACGAARPPPPSGGLRS